MGKYPTNTIVREMQEQIGCWMKSRENRRSDKDCVWVAHRSERGNREKGTYAPNCIIDSGNSKHAPALKETQSWHLKLSSHPWGRELWCNYSTYQKVNEDVMRKGYSRPVLSSWSIMTLENTTGACRDADNVWVTQRKQSFQTPNMHNMQRS